MKLLLVEDEEYRSYLSIADNAARDNPPLPMRRRARYRRSPVAVLPPPSAADVRLGLEAD